MSAIRRLSFSLAILLGSVQAIPAELSKAQQILLNQGLQIQGMVTRDDVFHLNTFSNAGFTSINWLWESTPSLMGPAPGFGWSRWVNGETNMPGQPRWPNETPYLGSLLSLQLADEWDLNTQWIRERAVAWFNSVRTNWPNTILYGNNWGGQISDAALGDFIGRARPDMLCFDTYPFQSEFNASLPNHTGNPIGWDRPNSLLARWYGDLRQYRAWALSANIPFGIYRQSFHAVQDYNSTVYRDPSPSELRLNTFAALAFNAKWLINFTYNTGASSLFRNPGGDSYPTALYAEQADVNRRALNLGKALVCLKPVYELHNQNDVNPPLGPVSADPCVCFQDGMVSSILFVRGRYLAGGVTNWTDLPNSFQSDPQAASANPASPSATSYSWWEYQKNDPYLAGWVVTNKAAVKNNGLPGEVIIAWLRPLDESFDGPAFTNETYMMVVNGLTATNGTAADCLQEIKLNFIAAVPAAVVMLDAISGQLQTNTMPIIPNSGGRRQLVLNLNGGDAALFKFDDGAPFVGFARPSPPRLGLRLESGTPSVSLTGLTPGARYQLESTPWVANPAWTCLASFMLTSSNYEYLDVGASNGGFYRAIGLAAEWASGRGDFASGFNDLGERQSDLRR
ncbi:MAG TPA: hypothetical protein VJA21_23145 [Verrucomicrobiae bacterium]